MPADLARGALIEAAAVQHLRALREFRLLQSLLGILPGRGFLKNVVRALIVMALVFGPNAHFASAALPGIAPADLGHVHETAGGSPQHHEPGACHACRVKLALLPPPPVAFTFLQFENAGHAPVTLPLRQPVNPALRDKHPPRAPPRTV